ncbi:MAG: hypothetical protein ABIH92_04355, partial [Nanoarchaeota archaeon]
VAVQTGDNPNWHDYRVFDSLPDELIRRIAELPFPENEIVAARHDCFPERANMEGDIEMHHPLQRGSVEACRLENAGVRINWEAAA